MRTTLVTMLVSTLLLGAACGGSRRDEVFDAPAASPDAAIDGAPPAMTITVFDEQTGLKPTADIPVVISRSDGTVRAVVRTDANGKARASIEPGDAVTAI